MEEALLSLPHGPLHGVAHGMAACFLRVGNQEEQSERETQKKTKAEVFITSFEHGNLCPILFIRSKSLSPAHEEKKTTGQEHAYRQARSLGAVSETAYHNFYGALHFMKGHR